MSTIVASPAPELFPGAARMSDSSRRTILEQAQKYNRRIMPPVHCYSFCSERDGHPGEFSTSDQTCHSQIYKIPTVMYPPQKYSHGEFQQEYFAVWLSGHHDGENSRVSVSLGESAGLDMALGDARAVADAILAVLTEAAHAGIKES